MSRNDASKVGCIQTDKNSYVHVDGNLTNSHVMLVVCVRTCIHIPITRIYIKSMTSKTTKET